MAIFGNFINRVVVLTHKYYEGNCPDINSLNEIDEKMLDEIYRYPKKIGDLIENYKFREAVNTVIDLARLGNKYLADEEPWKLIKTDKSERVKTIINIALQLSGVLGVICEPFLPNTALKLRKMLNLQNTDWNSISKENPILLSKINEGELIFRKIEDEEIDLQLQKLNESK